MKVLLVLALCVAYGYAARLPYIVGGRDVATPGKWPFMASLQFMSQHSCGASLISSYWLVCAAHCTGSPVYSSPQVRLDSRTCGEAYLYQETTYLKRPNYTCKLMAAQERSTYTIVLGMHDRIDMSMGDPTVYSVADIINHPSWENEPGKGFPNDISLVRIRTPANLNSAYISTVAMASASEDFVGSECYIMGWGMTIGGGGDSRADILQEAKTKIYTNTQCQNEWGTVIKDYHICIGNVGSSTSCSSDSGGPLVCSKNGAWILAGATSWGDAMCTTKYLSVYSRISYYRSWIKSETGV